MKNLLILFLIFICLSCKSTKEISNSENLAELIIEVNDKKQEKSFKDKIQEFKQNPETVFYDGDYCYDTQNKKNQAFRENSPDIRKNIEWFLLIDNLCLSKYLWEIDWKFSEDEILAIIGVLAKKKGYTMPVVEKVPKNAQLDAGGKMAHYNKLLNKSGLTLINLYIDSDSYVTGLIQKENLKKIIAKASETGNKITEY